MGWGVKDEETFAARLSAKLARPVLNLAVSSYGTDRELRRWLATPAARDADNRLVAIIHALGQAQSVRQHRLRPDEPGLREGQAEIQRGVGPEAADTVAYMLEVCKELGDRLGSGGMSTVRLAFDRRLERHVAVKLLAEHLARDHGAK